MCGIVGIVAGKPFPVKGELLKRLKKLEYRGYDSVGYATAEGDVRKAVGQIDDFVARVPESETRLAISHARWATHGGVTEGNAHPHWDPEKKVFIVHNGIIENSDELKDEIAESGVRFISETDSEVISQFISARLEKGASIEQAIQDFMSSARGTYAVLLLYKGDPNLYAFKKDSPIALGVSDGKMVLASDIYAFSDLTKKVVFFDDHEYAVISPNSYSFYNANGKKVEKEVNQVDWEEEASDSREYEHYMLKEIHEQPAAASRLINSLTSGNQKERLSEMVKLMKESKRTIFVACGSSYFATLLGVYFLHETGTRAQTLIASEFENFAFVDSDTLVVAVSQSGETMDVVSALKYAKSKGARIASIVNVPYSTIQRMSDASIEIYAGQEVCVASTKTFTNQALVMLAIAGEFGFQTNLGEIPAQLEKTIGDNEQKAIEVCKRLKSMNDVYVLGRGISYPAAREFALKLKEIAYVHAEGMMGGELKHGTIALIEEGTPVVSLIPNHDADIISNTREVEARGAWVLRISNNPPSDFAIPAAEHGAFALMSVIIGQLLAYYTAYEKELPIDKPRNLAKSVTVK